MGRKNNLTAPNKAWEDLKYSNFSSKTNSELSLKNEKPIDASLKAPMPNVVKDQSHLIKNNSSVVEEEIPYSVRVDAKEFTESIKPIFTKILNDLKKNNVENKTKRDYEHKQTLRILTIVTIGSLLCSLVMAFICLSTCRSISKLVQVIQQK
jgi:hypothetical protein